MSLKSIASLLTKALPVVVALAIGLLSYILFGGIESTESSGSFACPMLCVVLTSPGVCPVCGMDLEHLEESGDTLLVSDIGIELADISSIEVKELILSTAKRFPAEVVYTTESLVEITTWAPGRVTDIRTFGVGELVEQGQILAVLHSPEVQSAQADYNAALSTYDSYLINSAKLRLEELGSYPIETSNPSSVAYIRSPVTGTLGEITTYSGAWLSRGETFGYVIDNSGIELKISIPVRFDNLLEGDLSVSLVSFDTEIVETVSRIEPVINIDTQTRSIYASLSDTTSLTPGMFLTAEINFNAIERPSLAIPARAVLSLGERNIVYVDLGRGRFVPRLIDISSSGYNQEGVLCYSVTHGLNLGEKVVLDGAFLLDSQAELTGITSLMNETGNL